MSEVTIIGVDLAKRVFQLHGAHNDGSVAFRKKLSRGQLIAFVALGHDVRLIPPSYVKPFVKRQKNDVADAEAIVEAAIAATMRGLRISRRFSQPLFGVSNRSTA